MSTYYNNTELSVVGEDGNVYVMYPLTHAKNVVAHRPTWMGSYVEDRLDSILSNIGPVAGYSTENLNQTIDTRIEFANIYAKKIVENGTELTPDANGSINIGSVNNVPIINTELNIGYWEDRSSGKYHGIAYYLENSYRISGDIGNPLMLEFSFRNFSDKLIGQYILIATINKKITILHEYHDENFIVEFDFNTILEEAINNITFALSTPHENPIPRLRCVTTIKAYGSVNPRFDKSICKIGSYPVG